MNDKEILEEVHRRLQGMASVNAQPIKDFIEQEWQRRDEAAEAADEMMEAANEIFDCRHDNYFGPNEFTN